MVTSNNKYASNAPQKNLIALGLISLPRSDIHRLLPLKGHIFVVGFLVRQPGNAECEEGCLDFISSAGYFISCR